MTSPVPIEKRLSDITAKLDAHAQRIQAMRDTGGFADAKTLGMRAKRTEDRLEVLEADRDMLMDVNALLLGALREHLIDRHNTDMVVDNDRDVVNVRRSLRRVGEWADKRGLRARQRDVFDAMRDENRLRPKRVVPPPPLPTTVEKGGLPHA